MKASDRVPGPFPYWGASGVVDKVSGYLFDYPTLLVSEDGENLRTRKTPIAFHVTGKYWVNNHAHVLRAAPGFDLGFLTYAVESTDISGYITGSTQPKLTAGNLARLTIPCPPHEEQKRIAQVLGAMDALVDGNCSLVDSLVQLVDATFSLRFGERELSLEAGSLAKVVDCLHSKKPERLDTGRVYLQLNNILDNGLLSLGNVYLISDADYTRWTRNLETAPWDCVITNVGRVGAVARIPAGVRAAIGRNMTALRPTSPDMDGAFLLAALLSAPVRREIALKTDSGTILEALNVKSIAGLRLPNASESERAEFQIAAAPMLELADSLLTENVQLRQTREELMPLLLSGRVTIREAAS